MIGVLAVAWFDLQTRLPLLDEYARRWSIEMFVAGRGFQTLGSSPNLVQLLLSAPLAWLNTDPALWRLTAIPFLAMQGVFVGLIARHLGANKFWSVLGGVCIICNPLNLALSTGMMTETTFLGLFAAAMWAGLNWVETGRFRWLCVALTVLATLQRPQGVGLAAVVLFGLLFVASHRRNLRQDGLAGFALLVLSVVAFRLPSLLSGMSPRLAGSASTTGAPTAPLPSLGFEAFVLANLPALLGLTILPMAAGLVAFRRTRSKKSYLWVLPALLAGLAIVFTLVYSLGPAGRPVFVGNIVGATGLGAPILGGSKVSPFPPFAFAAVEVAAIATYGVVLLLRRDLWTLSKLSQPTKLLLGFSGVQLLFIMGYGEVFDRYYLAVILPLVPVLAAAAGATTRRRLSAAWAIVTVLGSLTMYFIGVQDYEAWQEARHRAAEIAYTQAAVNQVDAGFEENAVNIWIPADEDPTGNLPRQVAADPQIELLFSVPNDPRPGVAYRSPGASGKIVINRRH
ncbi:MAG TPA: hypothetical protein VNV65_02340 [Candidatus Solibacter sp.]|nr:hypothetical protein [Candidatus Solibacter sp.]